MRKPRNPELDNLKLRYKVKDYPGYEDDNKKNYKKMDKALKAVGVVLQINDGLLTISINDQQYETIKKRNAGPRHKIIIKREDSFEPYRYSDIVYMMGTMSFKEIYENQIHMAEATFFRHKNSLLKSGYYKSLDKNKLDDLEYLESVEGNYFF